MTCCWVYLSLPRAFSKEYKYTVGESLKKETIDLLILIYRVNTMHDKSAVLQEAKERIEVIRLLIRLMKDLHQIRIKNFVAINTIVEEVSKVCQWQFNQSGFCQFLYEYVYPI